MINGKFGQINLDGPNTPLRADRDAGIDVPDHEVTLRFRFVNRDTGAAISIPWLQFSLFDFDENSRDKGEGDGREARAHPHPPTSTPSTTPPPFHQAHHSAYLPVFEEQMAQIVMAMLQPAAIDSDRSAALCVFDDLIEHCSADGGAQRYVASRTLPLT